MLAAAGVGLAGAVAAAVALKRRRQRIAGDFERRHAQRFALGPDGVLLGAEPMWHAGSRTHAVLVLHGFHDTPQSVAPLVRALGSAGYTVHAPLLPGHGRSLRAMTAGRARDWMAHVRRSYEALAATHAHVFVCGQSMGAALATLLAAEHPTMPALALLAPFIGLPADRSLLFAASWVPQIASPYRRNTGGERSIHDPEAGGQSLGAGVVTARALRELANVARGAKRALHAVRVPTLYLQSIDDNRIRRSVAERNFRLLGSRHREQQWLTGCGHVIAVDFCRDEVARQVIAWFTRWAGMP